MRARRRHFIPFALLALAVLGACPAAAGVPAEQLAGNIERVVRVLEDPVFQGEGKTAARRAAVRRVALDIFDFAETARRCLGRHWSARTPAEQAEFVQLFTDLLERAYIARIESYGGEKLAVLGDVVDGEEATVRTRMVTRQGSDLLVDYRLHQRGQAWIAYDVTIEGLSLVASYRAQFQRIIQTSSYQDLVRKLKTRRPDEPKRTSLR